MLTEIPILFRSDEIAAVDKPVGISIHNAEDPYNLIEIVESQLGVKKLFPVHRLDKETSGVQIFALNELSARKFAEEFQSRLVTKSYVGILRGALGNKNSGVWSQPLTDKSEGRVNPAGAAKDRVPCETRFRVAKTSKYFTYCEFDLMTGRQHQIRKHAAINRAAIVGDKRYGDRSYNDRIAGIYQDDRMFLHCRSVGLLDHLFEAPIPEIFEKLLAPSD